MNERNAKYWNPSSYVSVDKVFCPYIERMDIKQYNPPKPAKYELLYRSLCHAKVPYTHLTLQYTGKPEVIGENDYYVTGCGEYTK